MNDCTVVALPRWVPDSVQHYLAHTEAGHPIRALARRAQCHASTILRQIRRIETRRDDPLFDAALASLANLHFPKMAVRKSEAYRINEPNKDSVRMTNIARSPSETPDALTLEREASRVLRRLCEAGAVLAVAENMGKAVVVRDGEDGSNTRTAIVDCAIAQAMALKEWIFCSNPGRISRYHITAAGRTELSRLLAEQENRARENRELGFAESQAAFEGAGRWGEKTIDDPETERPRRTRYNLSESPLAALARRKDRDGNPFLDNSLLRAGERLREDFELAQMGPRVSQNWDRFLTGGGRGGFSPDSGIGNGPSEARDRVARALSDLGPGLSDVALRCCCFLEGLEMAEKRMGWSARSGKIVLRIALQRLKQYYDGQAEPDRMIG